MADIIIELIKFLLVAIIAFSIGFAINKVLNICRKKEHSGLFYLVVVISIIYMAYMLFMDESMLLVRIEIPIIYYGFALYALAIILFFYTVYQWSDFSYYIVIVLAVIGSLAMAYEITVLEPYLSSMEYSEIQYSFIQALGLDFLKFGLIIGAKYKFLK